MPCHLEGGISDNNPDTEKLSGRPNREERSLRECASLDGSWIEPTGDRDRSSTGYRPCDC
jgi:hypothetical protein